LSSLQNVADSVRLEPLKYPATFANSFDDDSFSLKIDSSLLAHTDGEEASRLLGEALTVR